MKIFLSVFYNHSVRKHQNGGNGNGAQFVAVQSINYWFKNTHIRYYNIHSWYKHWPQRQWHLHQWHCQRIYNWHNNC